MKGYILNPYLPEYEYIPDGEPHVFGDRVYIYGSHDCFNGKKFCLNDYVSYSASVDDLKHWRYEGVIYKRTEDSRIQGDEHELWAPDVVQGKDGRYYLYYCPDDKIKSIGVAVCDTPAGEYHFLGLVQDAKGGIIGEREGDTIPFDPGVFMDEDGSIYLYSGNGPRTKSAIGKEPKASMVMTLADDMLTITREPKKLLPTLGEAEGSGYEGHEFFEASSIRKIHGKYYLIYSSVTLHELCYAISDYPDGGFQYGGVIISNADVMEQEPGCAMKNCYGNDHGGIECIKGRYYVFYHRQTNRSMFSRQGCAEEITILEDGRIPQVKMTSCGLNGGPLPGIGTYPAAAACNLYGKHKPAISHALAMGGKHPYITQDGEDYDPDTSNGNPPRQYITNGKKGMVAVYRYFTLDSLTKVTVTVRGKAKGSLVVYVDDLEHKAGEILVERSGDWTEYTGDMMLPKNLPGAKKAEWGGDYHTLIFKYEGRGTLDFLQFALG